MTDLRNVLGLRRLRETIAEQALPVVASAAAWWYARQLLMPPSVTRPLAPLELLLVLGCVAATMAWLTARQLTVLNIRRPRVHVLWGLGSATVAIGILSWSVTRGFASSCTQLGGKVETVQAVIVQGASFDGGLICRVNPVPDNVYLPGTLLRAAWDGTVPPLYVLVLAAIAALSALGLREARVAPSRLGIAMAEELWMAPAAGSKAVFGGKSDGVVQACGNPTLWGEPCGQLYSAEHTFEPGDWCIRCAQVFRRSERTITFSVVSLFSADIDVLNGLERMDATAWSADEAQPPDARLSGQERWVRLGQIEVPEVVTVSTLLQLVIERLDAWGKGAPPDQAPAFALAKKRASRLSSWIWIGHEENALTYARPTSRALLAVGPTRLKDLPIEGGERLALQLDIGLLPLELRTAFRQTFLDPTRPPLVQNQKQDVWVPVAPPQGVPEGLWVPRVEGDALRAWLALDRLRAEDARGVVSPRPYMFPELPFADAPVEEGRLDLVRMPLRDGKPVFERAPGRSIAEWEWMEEPHLELLRQQALVLVVT